MSYVDPYPIKNFIDAVVQNFVNQDVEKYSLDEKLRELEKRIAELEMLIKRVII